MKHQFLIIIFLLTGYFCWGQQSVLELPCDSSSYPTEYDFMYSLPKTTFLIEVTVIKTERTKGIYADYAEKLLGLKTDNKNESSYTLKGISVNNFLIPDNSHQYLVTLSSKEKQQFFNKFNNKEALTDHLFTPFLDSSVSKIPDFFRYYANAKYHEMEENYIETKIINGVVTQIPISQTKTISKTPEQQAQEAADQILKIRENRYQIIAASQEVPYSKEALEFMVNSLNEMEKNYMGLFIGNSIEKEIKYTFIVSPENDEDLLLPIFSFSKEEGINETDNRHSGIYYLKIEPQIDFEKWNNYQELLPETTIKGNGYRIRNSLPAYVSLVEDNHEFKMLGIYYIYQLGKIQILPTKSNLEIENWGFIY